MYKAINHYHFHSRWILAGPAHEVFELLQQIQLYPQWWPEVKRVTVIDTRTVKVLIRAALPYSLEMTMIQKTVDPGAGVLRAGLEGDLTGWSQWTIRDDGGRTTVVFEQNVEVEKKLMRTLAPLARPAFILNHGLMMKHGEKGLNRYLSVIR